MLANGPKSEDFGLFVCPDARDCDGANEKPRRSLRSAGFLIAYELGQVASLPPCRVRTWR